MESTSDKDRRPCSSPAARHGIMHLLFNACMHACKKHAYSMHYIMAKRMGCTCELTALKCSQCAERGRRSGTGVVRILVGVLRGCRLTAGPAQSRSFAALSGEAGPCFVEEYGEQHLNGLCIRRRTHHSKGLATVSICKCRTCDMRHETGSLQWRLAITVHSWWSTLS